MGYFNDKFGDKIKIFGGLRVGSTRVEMFIYNCNGNGGGGGF